MASNNFVMGNDIFFSKAMYELLKAFLKHSLKSGDLILKGRLIVDEKFIKIIQSKVTVLSSAHLRAFALALA